MTSSPAGIDCGATCAAPFDHGTVVTLSGDPDSGSKPAVWTGCDEVTAGNECKVTISAAKAVGAKFDLIPGQKLLKMKKAGTGSGTVTSTPAGIDCGSGCEAGFTEGTVIALSAVADPGSQAAVWSGCDEVTAGNECKVTLSAAKEVTASFTLETHQLTVSKTGNGTGTVTSSPAGISCGATCAAPFDHGTVVTLSGAPGANTKPVVWTGCDEVTAGDECKVTMSTAKAVSAEFAAIPKFTLKVKRTGNGSGTVTSSPAAINCGSTCEAQYNEGTVVTLSGAPGANTKAVVWSGCDEIVGANECKVTIGAAKEVTAAFALEQRQLTVTKSGTGSGTVTSAPAGINCGATCAAPFDHGTVVTLSGAAGANTEPVVWTGCDEIIGSNECRVTVSAAKSVDAKFAAVPGQFALKAKKTGNGTGTVTSSPTGINCGSTCEATYTEGTVVTLSGAPGANTKAVVWNGCDEVTAGNECKVELSAAKEVTAAFTLEQHQLTVTKSGTGSGTVTSSPAGIDCGATCSAPIDHGAVVTLSGDPDSGSKPVVWTGCDEVTAGDECKVTISAAKAVGAKFDLIPGQKLLKVKKAGNGSGLVTSTPAGIDCGSGCEAGFTEGTAVALSGVPGPGSEAVVWSGCDEVTAGNECKVTLSAAKEVTAAFALEQHQLTVTKSGTGSGTVTSAPAGISCGPTCSALFDHGTVVTLTPSPAEGSEFSGWSGACSGTGACQVSVTAAATVSAAFGLKPPSTETPQTEPPPKAKPPVETVPAPRSSLIGPPVTLAGPSSEIVDFGGVAMAPDGSGGVVYVKSIEGVPHIFANRYLNGKWGTAIRVDGDQPYGGDQPRIAAGNGGELLVVWVGPVATVHSQTRYGLFSAAIGRGGTSFGPSQLVDSNVGEGTDVGIDPSLSGTASGQAIVAYRVITYRFDGSKLAAQLRPGDVLADIRVARLKEDRWSGLGAINVNQELSTRAPSAANGPKVGAGTDGGAVVAWQEPDQSGTARIYARRIFGTVLGPILQASPSSWAGVPVSGDADAFSLAVTPLDQARIAMRIAGNGGEAPARIFLNTLPPGFKVPSNALVGAKQVFAAESASVALGVPGVAAYEKSGQEGLLRVGFLAGPRAQQTDAEQSGTLAPIPTPADPAAVPGGEAVTALNPEGGGTVAYPALDSNGRIALAVRQEFADGSAQVGLLSGHQQGGPIAELRLSGSGKGDGLIGFRQGEPGHYQIVADRVSARPSAFHVKAPKRWTKPRAVKLKWGAAGSAGGGVTYTVLIGGRAAKRGLRRHVFRPRPDQLGDGTRAARVMATDALGQQVLSKPVKLQVDGQPPLIRLHGPNGRGLLVRVLDADSGPKAKATWVSFGDGIEVRGETKARHVYAAPGRYRVVVRSSDKAGNRVTRGFEVRVR